MSSTQYHSALNGKDLCFEWNATNDDDNNECTVSLILAITCTFIRRRGVRAALPFSLCMRYHSNGICISFTRDRLICIIKLESLLSGCVYFLSFFFSLPFFVVVVVIHTVAKNDRDCFSFLYFCCYSVVALLLFHTHTHTQCSHFPTKKI